MKEDCIELPDAKTGGRVVPLGPEARAVLASLLRKDDNPWVIAGKLPGSHLTDRQRPWRRIRERAGLKGLRQEMRDLKELVAELSLENRLLKKKHDRAWGRRGMRYPASEKLEIIRLVEQSHLGVGSTLDKLGIPKTTFYRWYDRFLAFGDAGLEDRKQPGPGVEPDPG